MQILDDQFYLTMHGRFSWDATENMPIFERGYMVSELSDFIKKRNQALKPHG
jgi:hypothetical protein